MAVLLVCAWVAYVFGLKSVYISADVVTTTELLVSIDLVIVKALDVQPGSRVPLIASGKNDFAALLAPWALIFE